MFILQIGVTRIARCARVREASGRYYSGPVEAITPAPRVELGFAMPTQHPRVRAFVARVLAFLARWFDPNHGTYGSRQLE